METSRPYLEISQRDIDDILFLCEVAKSNKAPLTLEDVVALTTLNMTEKQLEKLWTTSDALNSSYTLSSGFITERNGEVSHEENQAQKYIEDMHRAQSNLSAARRFSSLIGAKNVKLISVSGSTSYLFARADDDIDFFCVSASDEMWIFMLKALIIARIYGWRNRGPRPICLSCVMDERRALHEFASANDPLFARDALTARIILGSRFFRRLLGVSQWMRRYYPRLYESKSSGAAFPGGHEAVRKSARRVINSYLYLTVGSYIRLKAHLLNGKFRRGGRTSSLFRVRLGEDHCIYESVRYQELRATYSSLSRS